MAIYSGVYSYIPLPHATPSMMTLDERSWWSFDTHAQVSSQYVCQPSMSSGTGLDELMAWRSFDWRCVCIEKQHFVKNWTFQYTTYWYWMVLFILHTATRSGCYQANGYCRLIDWLIDWLIATSISTTTSCHIQLTPTGIFCWGL